MIRISSEAIDPCALRDALFDDAAGAYCGFEGWIRNVNEGQSVIRLEYEVYEPLSITEGEKILAEAAAQFPHLHAHSVHRSWLLRNAVNGFSIAACSIR